MADIRSFRQLMGCFATGITVVTTGSRDAEGIGLTINSLTSVSLSPLLLLFCLDRKAQVYPLFKKSKNFAVNILAEGQEEISRHFADCRHHAMPKGLWDRPQEGCPILKHTLGWMACRTISIHRAGDHDIFVGEVVALKKRTGAQNPLLYFHGRYRRIGNVP